MTTTIERHAPPPDWSLPYWQERREQMIARAMATLPDLVAKLDAIAPFIETNFEHYEQTRGMLVACAYAKAWDLPSSIAMIHGYIQRDPTQEPEIDDMSQTSNPIRFGLSIGDTLLFDKGIMDTDDFFKQRQEELQPLLDQALKDSPDARIIISMGCIVAGTTSALGWNTQGVEDYLRGLLVQAEAQDLDQRTDGVSKDESFVSRL